MQVVLFLHVDCNISNMKKHAFLASGHWFMFSLIQWLMGLLQPWLPNPLEDMTKDRISNICTHLAKSLDRLLIFIYLTLHIIGWKVSWIEYRGFKTCKKASADIVTLAGSAEREIVGRFRMPAVLKWRTVWRNFWSRFVPFRRRDCFWPWNQSITCSSSIRYSRIPVGTHQKWSHQNYQCWNWTQCYWALRCQFASVDISNTTHWSLEPN